MRMEQGKSNLIRQDSRFKSATRGVKSSRFRVIKFDGASVNCANLLCIQLQTTLRGVSRVWPFRPDSRIGAPCLASDVC